LTKPLRHFLFFGCAVLFLCVQLSAQKLDFVSYTVEEGLSQSEARCVYQDSRGYLWIGTAGGGVCKFDGTEFTEYSHKQGLEGTFINQVTEDSLGNMWFGTNNAGVSRYDGKTFTRYDYKKGLGSNSVTSLSCTKDRVYIGTAEGLYEFDLVFEQLRRITSVRNITALHIDNAGDLYVGADTILYRLVNGQLQVITFPKASGLKHITALGSDDAGLLYVGCDDGLMLYKHGTKMWSDNSVTTALSQKKISHLTRDHLGSMWIATQNNLVVRAEVDGRMTLYNRSNGLLADNVYMIVEDDTRHIWMATKEQSLVKLRSEAFTYYDDIKGLSAPTVFRLFEDHNGRMWVGSNDDGLYTYLPGDGNNPGASRAILNGSVPFKQPVAICEDSSKRIWVGHYNGATCLVNERPVKTILNGIRVRALCADSKGNLWIGTWGNGLYKDDGKTLTNYTVSSGDLPQDYIHDIFEDSKGNIWLGTGAALVKYDPAASGGNGNAKFQSFMNKDFCNSYIGAIREDRNGRIWFYTDLCVMRYDGTTFTSYDEDDGLASNTVFLIEFDSEGRLWVGTNKGLDCVTLNGQSNFTSVRNYGKNEGFRGIECNSRAVCLTRSDELWFGTVKGVISYNPANDQEDVIEPNVHLTGIRLFLEKTDWTWSGGPQGGWFQLPSELTLEHDHNQLTFLYEGVHLQSPSSIHYKFMLVGFDSVWQPVTSQTEFTYTNLPPGQYKFRVIASNGQNVWNQTPAESCLITILPPPIPFWATWWFVLLVIVSIGGILYYITVLRNRIVKKQREALEEEIRLRTQEISRQNEEKSLMLKEIHHRVKNNLQIISSLLNLHADTIQDQRVLSLFEDLRHRVNSMALIHEKMYQSKNLVNIDMAGYIDELIRTLIDAYDSNKNIRLKSDIGQIEFKIDTIVPLGLILSEIVSNSLKYAFEGREDGEISISMKKIGTNMFSLEVGDNGSGLPPEIHFKSTESLGMMLIRMLTEQLNGDVTVRNENGTHYKIVFKEEVKERF
jgi:two-component sensor histidine kinase/ligand-binding sensor domain-containing protein